MNYARTSVKLPQLPVQLWWTGSIIKTGRTVLGDGHCADWNIFCNYSVLCAENLRGSLLLLLLFLLFWWNHAIHRAILQMKLKQHKGTIAVFNSKLPIMEVKLLLQHSFTLFCHNCLLCCDYFSLLVTNAMMSTMALLSVCSADDVRHSTVKKYTILPKRQP